MSSFFTLDISPLRDILFASILFHSMGCFFVLLIASFTAQSLLVWCGPVYLFIYFLLLLLPGVIDPKKHIVMINVNERVLFSSRDFMASELTYEPLIHDSTDRRSWPLA